MPSVSRYAVSNTIRDVISDISPQEGDTEKHLTHIDASETMVVERVSAGCQLGELDPA